ncbi:MAG: OmpH family outer membrane protein [Bacteroidota bacterium]
MEEQNMQTEMPENIQLENATLNRMSKQLRLSLLINGILLVAVLILYIMLFSGIKKNDASTSESASLGGNNNIAYVNSDTLIDNYDLVKELKADLEKKKMSLESDVSGKQQSFETKVKNYQDNLQKKRITDDQAKNAESKLMKERQDIMELSDKYTHLLSQQELEMNYRVQDSIINIVHRLKSGKKYDFILGFSKGGGILFANEKHNITGEVLKQLNEEYKKK